MEKSTQDITWKDIDWEVSPQYMGWYKDAPKDIQDFAKILFPNRVLLNIDETLDVLDYLSRHNIDMTIKITSHETEIRYAHGFRRTSNSGMISAHARVYLPNEKMQRSQNQTGISFVCLRYRAPEDIKFCGMGIDLYKLSRTLDSDISRLNKIPERYKESVANLRERIENYFSESTLHFK